MTLNWRKPVILAALRATGSNIPRHLGETERVTRLSRDEIEGYQAAQLESLLLHAFQKVPYYRRILPESGVISGGKVDLGHFEDIPLLTKEIIRKEGENLYASDYRSRKPYRNTSGGSTGEPIEFVQDQDYDEWNTATKLFFGRMFGKDIGDREIKFWGSYRDILEGTIGFRNRVQNFFYNREFINTYKIDHKRLERIIGQWNRFRPAFVWSYVSSAIELANYIHKSGIRPVHIPRAIVVTGSVLTDPVRTYLEETYRTGVYNQYGSREVGAIACECREQDGLHVFDLLQYVELQETANQTGGELIITNLRNYSMPFIRYQIGDTGEMTSSYCSCGWESHMIRNVTGRTTEFFIRNDGTKIGEGYFYHLFDFRPWVKKFQIIQKDYSRIVCRIVPERKINFQDLMDMEAKIRHVMGDSCTVDFEFTDEIEPTPSGKYRFVVTEVPDVSSENPAGTWE